MCYTIESNATIEVPMHTRWYVVEDVPHGCFSHKTRTVTFPPISQVCRFRCRTWWCQVPWKCVRTCIHCMLIMCLPVHLQGPPPGSRCRFNNFINIVTSVWGRSRYRGELDRIFENSQEESGWRRWRQRARLRWVWTPKCKCQHVTFVFDVDAS